MDTCDAPCMLMCARYCIEYKNISRTALLPVIFQRSFGTKVKVTKVCFSKKFKYFRSRSLFYLDKLAELFARDIISDNTNEVILNSPYHEGNL